MASSRALIVGSFPDSSRISECHSFWDPLGNHIVDESLCQFLFFRDLSIEWQGLSRQYVCRIVTSSDVLDLEVVLLQA
ncbi:hypothetical protein Hamer_G029166 [Homarus americanus]|uniref:Uncharacterized protein n=1 Tax=Homarus americanus TaxID=6706 RepID=A0A8J5JMQ2_HOMAM|nr:hypothetical protein Hamer_G029166 [Homarus americanus]